jgi:hypothetical protein
MASTSKCRHEGSVVWNPWTGQVECSTCKQGFFAVPREEQEIAKYGLVLRAVGVLEVTDELVRDLGEELFRAVRTSGGMTDAERPVFEKIARRAAEWLMDRARMARESR